MKNIIISLCLCCLLAGWVTAIPAHEIHLKDGSVIRSDTVWEETMGYFMDEVSLYAYQKAGMPENIVARLQPLQNQQFRSKERLLQLIQQRIGADALQRYQPIVEKYVVKKEVVSYEKYGNTIHLKRSDVARIEYSSPPPSLAAGYIDPDDQETKRAIEAEKAMLYERLRKIRDRKSAYVSEEERGLFSSGPVNYKEEMRNTQQRIKELERNPIGYFLRYYPELIHFSDTPSAADCYTLCDGASASVAPPDGEEAQPLIRAAADENLQRYKRCMAACQQEQPELREAPEKTKRTE